MLRTTGPSNCFSGKQIPSARDRGIGGRRKGMEWGVELETDFVPLRVSPYSVPFQQAGNTTRPPSELGNSEHKQ